MLRPDPCPNPTRTARPEAVPESAGIFHRSYLLVTLGACALVFLAAFESLAVTTIMPLVSRELDGAGLYALAFAGPLATGVIGMVAAGNWSDRRGPVAPLLAAVGMFVLGLLIAGTAGTMPVLVSGRLVQGLGGGGLTVALYVVIARVYPPVLHPKIFAAFSAAWVIPSLVGPFAAGAVAQLAGWQWVFLGVVGLVVPALLLTVPALRGLNGSRGADRRFPGARQPRPARPSAGRPGQLALAALAALAVLGLNLSAAVPVAGGGAGGGRRRRRAPGRPSPHAARNPDRPARPAERDPYPRAGVRRVFRRRGLPAVPARGTLRLRPDLRGPHAHRRRHRLGGGVGHPGPARGPGWSTGGRCGSARPWCLAPSSWPS